MCSRNAAPYTGAQAHNNCPVHTAPGVRHPGLRLRVTAPSARRHADTQVHSHTARQARKPSGTHPGSHRATKACGHAGAPARRHADTQPGRQPWGSSQRRKDMRDIAEPQMTATRHCSCPGHLRVPWLPPKPAPRRTPTGVGGGEDLTGGRGPSSPFLDPPAQGVGSRDGSQARRGGGAGWRGGVPTHNCKMIATTR